MGKVFAEIDDKLASWISRQHMFFVGTAPAGAQGSINVSPKGMGGTFAVLGPQTVAYLDYTGSGTETIAHLRENGRIVVMFCAFDGPPRIVRLHGRGEVLEPASPDFTALASRFPPRPGVRAVIRIRVQRVSTSCGFAVPLMDYRADRTN